MQLQLQGLLPYRAKSDDQLNAQFFPFVISKPGFFIYILFAVLPGMKIPSVMGLYGI